MSRNRKQSETGWGPPKVDQDGQIMCRRCDGPVPKGRRTFCSRECVHEWRIRTDPSYVRLSVFARDIGVCAKCKQDTVASRPIKRAAGTGHLWQADHIVPVVEGGGECGLDNYRTLCTACHKEETKILAGRRAVARSLHNAIPSKEGK